ncbi:MAG: lipocalin-like domain-containing protein [Bacteroidaceae bacterium]|nr:lipocalin-like domain-containing protein [Bacteroidaceae bacterium]
MKRLFIILFSALMFVACDKVYINGDLDGMWQLQRVERGGEIAAPVDIYYSFQRHLTFVSKHYDEELPLRYLGNLHYSGDTVVMSGFRKFLEEEIVATVDALSGFYLYSDSTVFVVERLDDETLVMRSSDGRYTLRRW